MTEPYVIDKTKIEYCPQCLANNRGHIKMQFHHAHIFHGIYDADRGVGIWACDEKWKCSKCRYVALFGFPITKAMYDATLDAWRGNYEWTILSENEVARRFEELGYLDVRVKGDGILVELPLPEVPPDRGVKKWGPKERVKLKVTKGNMIEGDCDQCGIHGLLTIDPKGFKFCSRCENPKVKKFVYGQVE